MPDIFSKAEKLVRGLTEANLVDLAPDKNTGNFTRWGSCRRTRSPGGVHAQLRQVLGQVHPLRLPRLQLRRCQMLERVARLVRAVRLCHYAAPVLQDAVLYLRLNGRLAMKPRRNPSEASPDIYSTRTSRATYALHDGKGHRSTCTSLTVRMRAGLQNSALELHAALHHGRLRRRREGV